MDQNFKSLPHPSQLKMNSNQAGSDQFLPIEVFSWGIFLLIFSGISATVGHHRWMMAFCCWLLLLRLCGWNLVASRKIGFYWCVRCCVISPELLFIRPTLFIHQRQSFPRESLVDIKSDLSPLPELLFVMLKQSQWKRQSSQGIQKKVTWVEYSYHRLI